MKIVMIYGQNHKGSSYHIGRSLAEKLCGADEITEFFLPRDMDHFCLGCYSCIENQEKCPFYEDKRPILEALEQAELFIFTTPNYCLGPSAQMKAFIDLFFDFWMVHRPKKWMFSKKAVVISASAGASNKSCIGLVKKALFYMGVPYIKGYGLPVQASNWEMVKPEKKLKIEKAVNRLSDKLNRVGLPRVGFKTKFIFWVMRGMHSAGWDSSPVEKEYWQENGWLDKNRPWKKSNT